MRKYELTYLVSDDVPESDLNKVTGKVAGIVEELGGKIAKEDIWGRRKLAYPIKKQDFATYVTIYLDLPAERAIEFEKDLRHIDGIVRQLMTVKDYGAEELTLTAEEVAETKEIEEVIGGEKSFEAVEGETEESRRLMAKREAQEIEGEPHFAKASRGADAGEPIKEAEKEISSEIKEEVETEPRLAEEKESEPEVVEEAKEITKEEPTEKPEDKKPVGIEKKKAEKAEKVKKTPTKKKSSPAKATADEKVSDEVERLSKLNEELDDILKDEL